MASQKNWEVLARMGLAGTEINDATANDLVVAISAEDQKAIDAVVSKLDGWLMGGDQERTDSHLHSLEDGLLAKPNANLAVISVPGEFAAREARNALEKGLNVFLFSDNVRIDDELALKLLAWDKHLLVMGPDCGTCIINGIGIGFANVIRRGNIGVIGAAGTGIQEFTCQVHNAGFGISQAIGTGSHDLSEIIGGLTTLSAIDGLEDDKNTQVIAILSKPPSLKTLEKLIGRIKGCKKPVVGCFIGTPRSEGFGSNFSQTDTIDEAVQNCIQKVGGKQKDRLDPKSGRL